MPGCVVLAGSWFHAQAILAMGCVAGEALEVGEAFPNPLTMSESLFKNAKLRACELPSLKWVDGPYSEEGRATAPPGGAESCGLGPSDHRGG